ncbi:MAG: TonB-dependent receptor [Novosphingobium sp.]
MARAQGEPNPTLSADAATSEPSKPGEGDIVVTGTRLRSGLTAPTPLVVVSADQLRSASPQQISDSLNQLPMFKSSSSAANGTGSSNRDNGGAYLNLRGLGKERTLVLVDGRRMVATTAGGAIDIALIPQELVRTVDIVTGGASAAYGSDAVAGVVNFRLDTRFKGLKLNVQKGISTYGDSAISRVALTGGTDIGSNGHIVASLEYFKSDGLGRYPTGRPITDLPYGLGPTGLASPTRTIVYPSLYSAPAGGLINTGPLAGNRFLPDGTLTPYNLGTNRSTLMQAGGDGTVFQAALVANVKRYNAFVHADFDLGNVKIYGEGLYSESKINYPYLANQQATVFSNAATIFRGNPYVNPAIAGTVFGTTGSFTVSNIAGSTPYMTVDTRSRTFRIVAGFDWDIGGGWTISGYGMHGENKYRILNRDVGNIRNLFASLDAVRDPVSGNIVCSSTLSGFDAGCVPFNILGGNQISDAAKAWAFGTSQLDFHLKEDVASLNLRGSPLTLPAGTVEFAAGVEYRKENAVQTPDAISTTIVSTVGIRGLPTTYQRGFPGGWVFSAPAAFKGSYDVLEGFAEASAPIFKDSALGHLLSINGAIRLIRYSTVGTVTTWKAGVTYEPFADLRLRGTISRDIRAANIGELFNGQQLLQTSLTYLGALRSGVAIRSGNPNLRPEKADTLTAGIVFRPSWLPGLGISVDYYRIKVRDAMAQLSGTQTGDLCTLGAQYACNLITLDPITSQVTVLTPTLNLASLRTSGVDIEVDYARSLGSGNINVKALVSYLHDLRTQLPNAPVIDRAGDLGLQGAPKWQGYLSVAYKSNGGFGAGLQERYIGSGLIDSTFAPTVLGDANKVPATWYTDISLSQEVGTGRGKIKLYATVNNLFNQQPRITPATPVGPYRSTNPQIYDIIGRYYTVGATVSF